MKDIPPRSITLMVITVLGLVLMPGPTRVARGQNQQTDVELSVNPGTIYINVESGIPHNVNTAFVEVFNPANCTEIVEFSIDGPSTLAFAYPTALTISYVSNFQLSVKAEPRIPVQNLSFTMSARVTHCDGLEVEDGDVATVEVQVVIQQFAEFWIVPDLHHVELELGESIDLDIDINNSGNGPDSFNIEVENIEELTSDGLEVSLSSRYIENVPSQDNGSLTLELGSGSAPPGNYLVRLRGSSEASIELGDIPTKEVQQNLIVTIMRPTCSDIFSRLNTPLGYLSFVSILLFCHLIILSIGWRVDPRGMLRRMLRGLKGQAPEINDPITDDKPVTNLH